MRRASALKTWATDDSPVWGTGTPMELKRPEGDGWELMVR